MTHPRSGSETDELDRPTEPMEGAPGQAPHSGTALGSDERGQQYQARVVTVSDRAASGARSDGTGPVLVGWLAGLGLDVAEPTVVPDDVTAVTSAVRQHLDAGARLVVTTGGTGIGPRDRTPEALAPMFDLALPGVAEAVRAAGDNPTACLSRTVAGVVGRSLVVALPGSVGACQDAMRVLTPVVAHALDQLDGGDHQ